MKKTIFFILAVGVSLLGATYRFGDSAHSIGLIKADGGAVKHAAHFISGKDSYTLIATATVIPPYRGDVRVALEGNPKLEHKIYASAPVIDLGLRKSPKFIDNILYNLNPKDRISLWVVIRKQADADSIKGEYRLALYDTKTNKSVLRVPLIFKASKAGGEVAHAERH